MRGRRTAVAVALVSTGLSCEIASGGAAAALAACGTDVSLGGGGDADTALTEAGLDATTSGEDTLDCRPCAISSACHGARSCASVDGGDAFCLPRCEASTQCEPDEVCGSATEVSRTPLLACVPKGGSCPTAVGPVGPDGGTLDQCGSLVGPKVTDAGCKDCHYDCQKNGCYGGYYCDVVTKDCRRPPANCL